MYRKRFSTAKKIFRKINKNKSIKRAAVKLKKLKQLFLFSFNKARRQNLLNKTKYSPTVFKSKFSNFFSSLTSSVKLLCVFPSKLTKSLAGLKFFILGKARNLSSKIRNNKSIFFKGTALLTAGIALLILPNTQTITTRLLPKNKEVGVQQSQTQEEIKSKTIPQTEPIKIAKDLTKNLEVLGEEIPQQIIIPKINVDLPVSLARVIDGFWELSDTSASFGLGSAFPGDEGNTVIFAHARDQLFGPLRRIKVNDKIYLLTKRHYFSYVVSEIKSVYPNQVEYVGPTTDERLTLFTCSGFLDSQRLLVIAKRSI